MSQESERIKLLSDVDLELEAQQVNPKQFPNHPVLRERESRHNAKERLALSIAESAKEEARLANVAAREANEITREALRITKHEKMIAIIAAIAAVIAAISAIVTIFLSLSNLKD
jgi:hypothetical protein